MPIISITREAKIGMWFEPIGGICVRAYLKNKLKAKRWGRGLSGRAIT
jgi:hypothetical protein